MRFCCGGLLEEEHVGGEVGRFGGRGWMRTSEGHGEEEEGDVFVAGGFGDALFAIHGQTALEPFMHPPPARTGVSEEVVCVLDGAVPPPHPPRFLMDLLGGSGTDSAEVCIVVTTGTVTTCICCCCVGVDTTD